MGEVGKLGHDGRNSGYEEEAEDYQEYFPMAWYEIDDEQKKQGADGTGKQGKADEEQAEKGVKVPGRLVDHAVGDQHRRAEQQERPAAKGDRSVKLVGEHLVGRDGFTQQERRFGGGEKTG